MEYCPLLCGSRRNIQGNPWQKYWQPRAAFWDGLPTSLNVYAIRSSCSLACLVLTFRYHRRLSDTTFPVCMTGYWSNHIAGGLFAVCTPCVPGWYGVKVGQTSPEDGCAACSPGTYSDAFGAASKSAHAVLLHEGQSLFEKTHLFGAVHESTQIIKCYLITFAESAMCRCNMT